jgi:uncharacterized protein (DUF2236 family)
MGARSIIRLPGSVQGWVESAANRLLDAQRAGGKLIDFSAPPGEAALMSADSMSWRVFKNPLALFMGGVAAVLLELAEPSVRAGVWEHSSFRQDPLGRLRRTGLAAMVTVYGARSVAEAMIAGIGRKHARVAGVSSAGIAYSALDARLLTWVQATATFGFAQSYSEYVAKLGPAQMDRLFAEAAPAARLYGARDAPTSLGQMRLLVDSMRGRLEASPVIFEFLRIMRETAIFPGPLQGMQRLLVRAAIELIPEDVRTCMGLHEFYGLRPAERPAVRMLGAVADRIALRQSPPALSCRRLGLPLAHLYQIDG